MFVFLLFSGLLAKILTEWSQCGIQGIKIHLWAYTDEKIFIYWGVVPMIFKSAKSAWRTCPCNNNLMKYFTQKRSQCMLWKRKPSDQ